MNNNDLTPDEQIGWNPNYRNSTSADSPASDTQVPTEPTDYQSLPVNDRRVLRKKSPNQRLYFDTKELPNANMRYVAWLDLMGSKSAMQRSLHISANNIGRLHLAILMHRKKPRLTVSPFMDGAYVRTENKSSMTEFLNHTFEELAHDFVTADCHEHRYLPRCGLSFGPIIEGADFRTKLSKILGAYSNSDYRQGILFGYPMVDAFSTEHDAPPFGIAIHSSAREFSAGNAMPFSGVWWRWFDQHRPEYLDEFKKTLFDYFDWMQTRCYQLLYPKDRIKVHREMAEEYFSE
jgi:hypothetical protein